MNKYKPIIVLLVICVAATAALAFFNELTKDAIAEQAAKTEADALRAVMSEVDTTALSADELAAITSQLTYEDQTVEAIYKAEKGGEFAGYIFKTTAKGYGGTITVITGIDADGVITGVKVISHAETAGLGAKAAVSGEGSWISQYAGKSAGTLSVVKGGNAGDDEIDAITSATKTSRAVTRAVNIAGMAYEALGGNTENE